MTFNFTEEQIMIRDMVREFTKKEVEPRDKWMDKNGFDYELHKKLTQAGLMGIHLDEKYGGGGGDAVTSIIVIHEIAKGSASEALFLDANWLAADLILYHGTEAQKDKYLPQAARARSSPSPDRVLRGLRRGRHQVHRGPRRRRRLDPQRRQGLDH